METFIFYTSILLLLACGLTLYVYGSSKKAKEFWATSKGKNVRAGIVMFVGLGVALAFLTMPSKSEAVELEYFQYGEVFLGVDNTFTSSPQCKKDQHNERLTSNGGFRFNVLRTTNKKVEVNAKYQHHSCAFNQDDLKYDALGIEIVWKLWSK